MKKLSIWLEDSTLCVELPGTGERSHVIKLPNGEWHRLFAILRHRGLETKIGEPGDPTQHQINAALKAKVNLAIENNEVEVRKVGRKPVTMTVEQRATVDEILRSMGLC